MNSRDADHRRRTLKLKDLLDSADVDLTMRASEVLARRRRSRIREKLGIREMPQAEVETSGRRPLNCFRKEVITTNGSMDN
jgi:hypothetical protein